MSWRLRMMVTKAEAARAWERIGRWELRMFPLVAFAIAFVLGGVAVAWPGGGIGYPNTMIFDKWTGRTNPVAMSCGTTSCEIDASAGAMRIAGASVRLAIGAGNDIFTASEPGGTSQLLAGTKNTEPTLFEGANNQDVTFGQQGTSKMIIHFPTGNGAGVNADSAFIDSDGIHMGRATGQRFDSNGQNFQIGVGGATTESITIAPGTGAATLAEQVGATGQINLSVGGSIDLQDTTGGLDIAHASGRPANATFGLKVASGTTMLHLDHGTVTLAAGTGTATLSSTFEHCVCTDATAVAAVKCNVSGSTTMTITGTGTDVVTYICTN